MTFISNPLNTIKSRQNSTTSNIGGITTLTQPLVNNGPKHPPGQTHYSNIHVSNGAVFLAGQTIRIDTEYIVIGTVENNTLVNCERAEYSSECLPHSEGSKVIGTFVGESKLNSQPDVMISLISDISGVQYFDFSDDNIRWSTFPIAGFDTQSNYHEFHTAIKGRRYFRVRVENNCYYPSSYFELHSYYGIFSQVRQPINQPIRADSDSIVVKSIGAGEDPNGKFYNKPISGVDDKNSTTKALNAGILTQSLNMTDTTIHIDHIDGFIPGDYFCIGHEFIKIGNINSNDNTFINCSRSQLFSDALSHPANSIICGTFVGKWADIAQHASISVSVNGVVDYQEPAPGTLYMQFSHNKIHIDRNIAVATADIRKTPPRTLGVITKYFRVIYANARVPVQETDIQTIFHTEQVSLVSRLNQNLSGNEDVSNVRAAIVGQQPDGDFVNGKASGSAFNTSTLLDANETFISRWVDTDGFYMIELFVNADQNSAFQGLLVEYTDESADTNPIVRASKQYSFNGADIARGYKVLNLPTLLDGFRVKYINGPTIQTSFYLEATLKTDGTLNNFNQSGVLQVSDFYVETLQGNISGFSTDTIVFRNGDIDKDSTPEDITEAGGIYQGFPSTSKQIEIFSDSNNDRAGGPGARTIKIYGLKTPDSNIIDTEIVRMNGKNKVYLPGYWWRIHKAEVLTAGNNGANVAKITIRGRPSSPNYCTIQRYETSSSSGVFTVPKSKRMIINKLSILLVSKKGNKVHTAIALNIKDNKQSDSIFIRKKHFNIQAGTHACFNYDSGYIIDEGSDLKMTVISATEKDCVISGEIEFLLINK